MVMVDGSSLIGLFIFHRRYVQPGSQGLKQYNQHLRNEALKLTNSNQPNRVNTTNNSNPTSHNPAVNSSTLVNPPTKRPLSSLHGFLNLSPYILYLSARDPLVHESVVAGEKTLKLNSIHGKRDVRDYGYCVGFYWVFNGTLLGLVIQLQYPNVDLLHVHIGCSWISQDSLILFARVNPISSCVFRYVL